MGSPYEISATSNHIHVIKTQRGFEKILTIISVSAGRPDNSWKECFDFRDPLDVILIDFFKTALETFDKRGQCVVMLNPRYDWTGSKKFSRIILLDFTKRQTTIGEEDAITRTAFGRFLADYVRKSEGI